MPVVYDSIGKDTWDKSLDCLAPFGYMISFGNASGAVPPVASPPVGQGIALRAAPDPDDLHRDPPAARGNRQRPVRRRHLGQGQDRNQPALRTQGRGAGPDRPGRPQDHRLDRTAAVTSACKGRCSVNRSRCPACAATPACPGSGLDPVDSHHFLQAPQRAHHARQMRAVRDIDRELHDRVVSGLVVFGVHVGDVGIGRRDLGGDLRQNAAAVGHERANGHVEMFVRLRIPLDIDPVVGVLAT